MSNHVHLLIRASKRPLGDLMRKRGRIGDVIDYLDSLFRGKGREGDVRAERADGVRGVSLIIERS